MATVKEYSVEEKLSSLLNLQRIDSKLDEIRILKGELPMEVRDLEDEIHGLHVSETRFEEEINGIDEFIKERESIIKQAKELLARYEKQSDNVKNNREFEALNKEIEHQRLEEGLALRHIKDAQEERQEKARVLDDIKKKIEVKDNHLKHKKGELDKIISETEKEENELLARSKAAREKVESRLWESYNRIRSNYKNGLSVVPILRDACGGCFNAIPPQRQSEVRQRKKILVCENCGRILVDDDLVGMNGEAS
jgi:predicted  nucleic acid-binding Zn-ribbon protein